jgi:hypothetical protein
MPMIPAQKLENMTWRGRKVITSNNKCCTNYDDYHITSIPDINRIEYGTSVDELAEFIVGECCKPNIKKDLQKSDVMPIVHVRKANCDAIICLRISLDEDSVI